MGTNGNSDRVARKYHFVLAQGDIPAAEVVQRAKAKGITLSLPYVYTSRNRARQRALAAKTLKQRATAAKRRAVAPVANVERHVATLEHDFVDCVIDLGIARSEELLQSLRRAGAAAAAEAR